jgi:hypothetical protein
MVGRLDFHTALRWHLTSNHFPPVPDTMMGPCIEAIHIYNDERPHETRIELPEGSYWRGETSAPAWAIVEGFHLDTFIAHPDDDDDYSDEL